MPITELAFSERTLVVLHNDEGLVLYHDMEPGSALGTGLPHVEQFTDEEEAKARALELGYVFPDPNEDPLEPPAPLEP